MARPRPPAAPGAPLDGHDGDAAPRLRRPSRRAPTPRADPDEVTRTLASLADLRDRGAITPEEYERKKAELLAGSEPRATARGLAPGYDTRDPRSQGAACIST